MMGYVFSVRVVKNWNELPEEFVTVLSLKAFTSGLDKFWNNELSIYESECHHLEPPFTGP